MVIRTLRRKSETSRSGLSSYVLTMLLLSLISFLFLVVSFTVVSYPAWTCNTLAQLDLFELYTTSHLLPALFEIGSSTNSIAFLYVSIRPTRLRRWHTVRRSSPNTGHKISIEYEEIDGTNSRDSTRLDINHLPTAYSSTTSPLAWLTYGHVIHSQGCFPLDSPGRLGAKRFDDE